MSELGQIVVAIRKVVASLEKQIAEDGRLPMWQEPLLLLADELERPSPLCVPTQT